MNSTHEIVICLGSSCFSRGNKKTLHAISEFLKSHSLEDKVYFHGAHCFDHCEKGPVMKINDEIYEHMTREKAIAILEEYFSGK
ncbi:MAG: (2Fe-2S) ferredoxin domain-containing protein [Bacteroidales bacterium]|nr:(2Fe-2S) ferredoxin domain-containing protein [Bacteroidales bacterium]MCF8334146.1 (2Fe-2S) ferredoxin domain-containing protein [Bacteroidales bacterium]